MAGDVSSMPLGGNAVSLLDRYATNLCVVVMAWLVVALQEIPDPQEARRAPVVASNISLYRGVGPMSALVVLVKVVVLPMPTVVGLADKVIDIPRHETVTTWLATRINPGGLLEGG